MSRRIVPVNLPCCPGPDRCSLCAPSASAVTAELVDALIGHYRDEVARPGDTLMVSFFGGAPPSAELLAPATGLPVRVRVRPDLLSRADAERLVAAGVTSIELDAAALDDPSLRAIGRTYRTARVVEMARGLRDLGVETGIVLAVGLPRSDHDSCLAQARLAADLFDTARLHPVLVLAGSRLEKAHLDGTYHPLTVEAAVNTCRAMLDVLEAGGVDVLRIGLQPGPDGFGRAVAGPRHPSLRQLVEAERALETLRGLVDGTPVGDHIVIRCAPADETRTRGPCNQHVRILRSEYELSSVRIQADPALSRGSWTVCGLRESA